MKNLEELFIQSKNPSIVWITAKFIEDKIGGQYYSTDYIEYERILKTNKLTVLKDVISEYNGGPMGFQLHSYDYLDQGVPVLRTKDMKELTIILDDPIFISQEKHNELKGSKTYPGDIIISKTGQIGVVAVVPKTLNEANLNQALCNIRVKEGIIDNYFLAVFLNSKYGQYQFIRQGEGKAVQNGLTKDEILDLQIPVISPEIQKYIGDKVRKAEELREEAKRLKKEAEEIINESLNIKQLDFLWEGSKVKFEWTSTEILTDRIDANYYEQKYVETINHIKKFSKKYITLNSIIDSIYTGKKPIYYEKGIEAYFVQSGNISSNFLELDNKEKVDLSKYNQILFGDLLIAKDGETIGKIAINLTNETIIINEHTYCVRLKDEYKCYSAYIYYFLTNKYINPLIRREATGSAQKGLNFTFTENIIIPILEEDRIMNLYNLEVRRCNNIYKSKQLIQEAKQDVEDLIEGNFDMSKVKTKS